MDNDNEVMIVDDNEKKIHQEVMLFLGEELNTIHKSTGGQTYEIESEFEKTTKHKSPFIPIVLAACLVFVVGIALIMHTVISTKNQEIAVSLEEFNDLNLKALLDTVASAQTNYDNAVKNRARIQADMENELREAEEALENDIFVIDSMNLKYKTVYNDKVSVAKKAYENKIQLIQDEFSEKLILAEKEVEAYKNQLAEFDTAKVESARNQEKALDSERQLRELETKKLTDSYEKRIAELELNLRNQQKKSTEDIRNAVAEVSKQYQHEIDLLDPTIYDTTADNIIQEAKNLQAPDFDGATRLLRDSIASEKVSSFVENYQKIYDDFRYLDDVVASIPQKNSIPKYVASARILVNDMGDSFVDSAVSFYEETVKLNDRIIGLNQKIEERNTEMKIQQEMYENSLSNILNALKASAMVLEGSNYDDIRIYVAPRAYFLIDEAEDGANAEIKAGKTYKGKIFRTSENSFRFEVAPDKDGNLPEIDFTLLEVGSTVKIFSK